MIIGIVGKARSGKDTIANILCNIYGFERDSLAAPIKKLVKDVFVLDDETVYGEIKREQPLQEWEGWTVRKLLQFIGTDLLRKNIDDRIWVKSLWMRLRDVQGKNFVIPDIRIPNEKEFLKDKFGKDFVVFKVTRPGFLGQTTGGISGHETEKYDIEADFTFENNGTIDNLNDKVISVMDVDLGIPRSLNPKSFSGGL